MLPKANDAPLARAMLADSGNNASAMGTVKRGANSATHQAITFGSSIYGRGLKRGRRMRNENGHVQTNRRSALQIPTHVMLVLAATYQSPSEPAGNLSLSLSTSE